MAGVIEVTGVRLSRSCSRGDYANRVLRVAYDAVQIVRTNLIE